METPVSTVLDDEEALLGSILGDSIGRDGGGRVWGLCQQALVMPDMFTDPHCCIIYREMQAMAKANTPIDPTSLLGRLNNLKLLEKVGGANYLQRLVEKVPTVAHAEHYLGCVCNRYKRRMLIQLLKESLCIANDRTMFSDENATELVNEVQRKVLAFDNNSMRQYPWQKVTEDEAKKLQDLIDDKLPTGLMTGLGAVDDIVQGLKPSEMIVIGARPSVGKTSFAMSIAEHLAVDEHHPVLIFSLEMDRGALNSRMLVSKAGLDSWSIRQKDVLSENQKKAAKQSLEAAVPVIKDAPIYVEDDPELDITQIRAIARRACKEHAIELVIIDYLTLCHYRDVGAKLPLYQEVSLISGQIKAMAKELQLPVIVLSQLSRKTSDSSREDDGTEIPKMSDLRESGSIEQDADVVMLLNKEPKKDPKQPNNMLKIGMETDPDSVVVRVNVAKNRNGKTGKAYVLFDKVHTRFANNA